MQIIREKLDAMKQTLDKIEDRFSNKSVSLGMRGKRFLYYCSEYRKDILVLENLLDKLDAIDRRYS